MPGITVGDIGPKLSTNDNDNGFLRFDRVRIPRRQMLMKHTQLGADGTLSRRGPEKASYATMTRVRASIVMVAGVSLSDAVTIALRFAAVRRQEPGAEPELERPILDYVSVQHLLLPVLADAYALRFVGQHMMQMYQQLERQVRAEDYSLNAIAHATSCALKSYCTTLGADGIIECQRSCGGHAFHQFSGLPELYGKYMPLFTAEGNNWLLTQQTSRFLLKLLHGNSSVAGASYLSPQSRRDLSAASSALSSLAHLSCLHRLAAVFERRCLWLLTSTHAAMQDAASPGGDPFSEDVFLKFLVEHYNISKAHAQATTLRAFINAIEHCSKPHPTPSSHGGGSDSSSDFDRGFDFDGRSLVNVLTLLCRLFALSTIDRELGGLLLAGCLDVATAAHIKPTLKSLLAQLRPVAIPLVDAFASTDWELNSALGRWDGDYVGTLYKWAQDNPLNKNQASLGGGPLLPGFEEHLRPIMVAKL
ncbi:MAG: acyl-CoA dehydrogenase [archaeon]|nr:acyl-CoA dehydrogenase [archaeon]